MTIQIVKKSNGVLERFKLDKLTRSIYFALKHADINDKKLANRVAHETLKHLEGKSKEIVDTAEIRNIIIHILAQDGYPKAAESYELTSLHLKNLKIHEVVKRNGKKEAFHPIKLFKSIRKAFTDAGMEGGKIAEEITKDVITELQDKHSGRAIPVLTIKKVTADVLKNKGLRRVEKYYLIHRFL